MKKNILFLILFMFSIIFYSQENINYIIKNQKIDFEISNSEIYLEFEPKQKSVI